MSVDPGEAIIAAHSQPLMVIGDAYTFDGAASSVCDGLIEGEVIHGLILIHIHFVDGSISNHQPLAVSSKSNRCLNISKASNCLSMAETDTGLLINIDGLVKCTGEDCGIIRDGESMDYFPISRVRMGLEEH